MSSVDRLLQLRDATRIVEVAPIIVDGATFEMTVSRETGDITLTVDGKSYKFTAAMAKQFQVGWDMSVSGSYQFTNLSNVLASARAASAFPTDGIDEFDEEELGKILAN